jgi:hypothetical protein
MVNYVVAIPSYNRSTVIKTKTLKTLIDGGVNKNVIHIFVANEAERKKYEEDVPKNMYGKIVVGKIGIAPQRKFIIKYFPENTHIVSADDDVEGLYRLKPSDISKMEPLKKVDAFFTEAFNRLKKEHLFIWGIYPVRNPFFMKNTVTTNLKFILGTLYGFINRKLPEIQPSSTIGEKEDYEQSILYYKKDGGVLRYNNIAIKTKFHAKGGLGEESGRFAVNKKAAEYLKKMYPDFVSIFQRKSGMSEIRLARITGTTTLKNKSKKTSGGKSRKRA